MAHTTLTSTGTTTTAIAASAVTANGTDRIALINDSSSAVTFTVTHGGDAGDVNIDGAGDTLTVTVQGNSHYSFSAVNSDSVSHSLSVAAGDAQARHGTSASDGDDIYIETIAADIG